MQHGEVELGNGFALLEPGRRKVARLARHHRDDVVCPGGPPAVICHPLRGKVTTVSAAMRLF